MKKHPIVIMVFLLFLCMPFSQRANRANIVQNIPEHNLISEKELKCLAENIFYEAPAEPYLGKLAVAVVTMNRVRHKQFPKTICGVVYQRNSRGCQFSWTCGPKTRFNQHAYDQSLEIAKQVLTNDLHIVSLDNALYFHNTSIQPNWTFAKRIVQIGNHIFYSTI